MKDLFEPDPNFDHEIVDQWVASGESSYLDAELARQQLASSVAAIACMSEGQIGQNTPAVQRCLRQGKVGLDLSTNDIASSLAGLASQSHSARLGVSATSAIPGLSSVRPRDNGYWRGERIQSVIE